MTEAVSGPGPSAGRAIKQESEAFGFFDSLDILATIATQELKSKSGEKEQTPDSEEDSDGRGGGRGSTQPKKLAEMEVVNMDQIRAMSSNTLLRIFTETDFDEMKRMYCYTCVLLPDQCQHRCQSFGNESKAKKEMRQHLEEHVDRLIEEGSEDFIAEPVLARKRRQKDVVGYVCKPTVIKKKIKAEPQIETEVIVEKENTESVTVKKRKDELVPMLTEISNEQEAKRYRVKNETVETQELFVDYEVAVKQEPRPGPGSRLAIDEDHCYAFRPGRVKAEYWPEYDNNAATAFTAIQETDETYDNIKDCSDLASVEVIQSCPVVLEEEYTMQQDSMFQQEFIVHTSQPQEEAVVETQVVTEPEPEQEAEYTAVVYQEQLGDTAEQFYTETIVTQDTGHMGSQESTEAVKQVPVRIKNKRTVAAVSSEDKRLALNAMEELRSRGATTDDLMCRLCDPARPFTAYSTLLTHYRSHAGLRPFECGLCGATFTRQHSLNYHLMTHANQTRFTCPHCNRKFRHPTHFKEHVKKHGEVVQFVCQFCSSSLSTQSQYRKHLKMRHNKTIDIMGNVIDSQADYKDRDKVRRKRKMTKDELDPLAGGGEVPKAEAKRKRRRKVKAEEELRVQEIGQYEEVVGAGHAAGTETGTVVYEETVPMGESEQMYHNSELMETQNGFEIIDNTGAVVTVLQQNNNPGMASWSSPPTGLTGAVSQQPGRQVVSTAAGPVLVPGGGGGGPLVGVSRVTAAPAPPSSSGQPAPVIFVVPSKAEQQPGAAARKPLVINEQKRPIVVSSFQTNAAEPVTKLNQGVIAQINGQKVLLVPKKKDNVQAPIKTNIQKLQPMTVKLASSVSAVTRTQPAVVTQRIVTAKVPDTVVTAVAEIAENQENKADAENNKVVVVNGAEKSSILEQAMHEVFPSSLEQEEGDKADTEAEVEASKDGVDLYNPLRSPLKNRNKILQEVLGIDA